MTRRSPGNVTKRTHYLDLSRWNSFLAHFVHCCLWAQLFASYIGGHTSNPTRHKLLNENPLYSQIFQLQSLNNFSLCRIFNFGKDCSPLLKMINCLVIDFNSIVSGYFIPTSEGIVFIVRSYLYFLCSCFLRIFVHKVLSNTINFKHIYSTRRLDTTTVLLGEWLWH